MKIVLATPLYPPEIAEPAPYVKELAQRLAGRHEVIIVAYARLPENVPGARMILVDKRRPLPLRLVAYFFALLRSMHEADIVYAQNGASVELPLALASFIIKRSLIIRVGDATAHDRAKKIWSLGLIERFAFSRAGRVITDTPSSRPEILPFEPYPAEPFGAYEKSWKTHLHTLEDLFNHARP